MTFETFFDQVSTISKKLAVHVFNLIDFNVLHIYCNSDTRSALNFGITFINAQVSQTNMLLLTHLSHHKIFERTLAYLPLSLPISFSVSIRLPKGYVVCVL